MILATTDDYDYPHIDWKCKECGEVYCYAGYPPETRCLSGHGHGWKPEDDQLEEYMDLLNTLTTGDGIVVCGDGPAALMGPVEAWGKDYGDDGIVITESIDSPRRKIRWNREDKRIEWTRPDNEYNTWSDVYHVESVEIQS